MECGSELSITRDEALLPIDALPGRYELILQFQNPFLPGSYVISADILSALGLTCLDYVAEALRFHVISVAASDQSNHHYNPGLVKLVGSWTSPISRPDSLGTPGGGRSCSSPRRKLT